MPLRTVILAPDSFKETLAAAEVARAMANGVRRASDSIVVRECPIGDGGEGTMNAIVTACGGRYVRSRAAGPFGQAINTRFALIDDDHTAVIELAQTAGLALVPKDKRNPMRTTTFGTGMLIMQAVALRCSKIIVCVGGSATVDGGAGIAQACGWRFIDRNGDEIIQPMCGESLARVRAAQPPVNRPDNIIVACDVRNSLLGPNGAAAIYGPQKGATPKQVQALEKNLMHFAACVQGDAAQIGSGAAGGAAFGMATLLNAQLLPGIDVVLQAVGFDRMLSDADLVITGEGRLDAQSLQGKACMGVANAAHACGVPTIAIVGSTGPGAESCVGGDRLAEYRSLAELFGVERAMRDTAALIADLTERIVRDIAK